MSEMVDRLIPVILNQRHWSGPDAEMLNREEAAKTARALLNAFREPSSEMVLGVATHVEASKVMDKASAWDWTVLHKIAIEAALKAP